MHEVNYEETESQARYKISCYNTVYTSFIHIIVIIITIYHP